MKMLMHVLFPKDLDPRAHEALEALTRDGLADPSFPHVCEYDALDHSPSFLRSGIVPYALVGSATVGTVCCIAAWALSNAGMTGLPASTGALLGLLGGSTLGGFASALGGIGAPDPFLDAAARNLKQGRMLMTFALTESRYAEKVERILESFGALEIHRQLR